MKTIQTKTVGFRNLLVGLNLTNFGDSLFLISIPIILYSKTESNTIVSHALFLMSLPMVFGYFISPSIEKIKTKGGLIVVQSLQLFSLVLILSILNDTPNGIFVVVFYCCTLLFSISNYATYLIAQSYVVSLCSSDELKEANSLLITTKNVVNSVSDAICGLIIKIFSYYTLYLINMLIYTVSLLFFSGLPKSNKRDCISYKDDNLTKKSLSNYCLDYYNNIRLITSEISSNKVVVSIILILTMMQFQIKVSSVSSVSFFYNLGHEEYYGFYYTIVFLGFGFGSWIAPRIDSSNNRLLLCTVYCIVFLFWISISTHFDGIGLLFSVFCSSIAMGIFEVNIITILQKELNEKYIHVISLIMSFAGIVQLTTISATPLLISLFSESSLIKFSSIIFLICVFVISRINKF